MLRLARYTQRAHAQLGHLLAKDARAYWRTPDYNATRMAIACGVALIFGSMYWMKARRRCCCCCYTSPALPFVPCLQKQKCGVEAYFCIKTCHQSLLSSQLCLCLDWMGSSSS